MKYTFEIHWPPPFKAEWRRSGKQFDTAAEAASAMAQFLVVALENDCILEARLCVIKDN